MRRRPERQDGDEKPGAGSSGKAPGRILLLLIRDPTITTEAIGKAPGIGSRAVRKQVAQLRDAGQLIRSGGRKMGRWQVPK